MTRTENSLRRRVWIWLLSTTSLAAPSLASDAASWYIGDVHDAD